MSRKALKSSGQLLFRRFLATESSMLSEMGKKNLIYNDTDGYVMKSPYGSVSIPKLTIDQYVWKNISKWPNHTAIECGFTGRKYTYAKLRDNCCALACRLRNNMKLEKNDIVGICLPNVPEYAIAFLGSIEGGLIVTTVNPGYTSEEISRQFMSCQPKAVFCLIDNYEVVKNACILAQLPNTKIIAIKIDSTASFPNGAIDFSELTNSYGINLSESSNFNKHVAHDDFILLPYSSGTTGLPKGVMLTHNNLVANCESIDVGLPHDPLVLPTTNDFQDVLPCFLPFFHIYGLMAMLIPKLALGAKVISIPKYEINSFLRITKEQKATFLHLVPPIVIQLGNYEGAKAEHFESVRASMSGASNLAQADVERLKKIAPNVTFLQGYGLTETSPVASLSPHGIHNYATIGFPVPNVEMKISALNDPSFKGVAPNETGELLVRGPNVMKGYYKNDEATKSMITKDNWLRTGDIGHYDENGLFYISDRLKELIKVNANQVAPAELEGILREHADILDAAVIGVKDPKCGEVPRAFVVRRPESNITEKDVQQFVAKQVIKYKQLTGGVQFVDQIPKTATGKILRREVRRIFL
ncbi:uncharacterized protein LOC129580589 [Sitodiplosis mosellana]|uniref:uncharacterized protein LOC129580589 n=1 Tax=Sitodiplosis mosellana TaxID=263140 RepID=UPI002444F7BB|nr:uncharacterized protein LOC129580589 [Sitodiplosis mosellana]